MIAPAQVGLLDIDLCGPSVPRMLGLQDCDVIQGTNGWIPVHVPLENKSSDEDHADGSLHVMSVGFLQSNPNNAVIWRGPKKNAMIRQFVTGVEWPSLDYLVIDTPPGTSDEHISIVESLTEAGHPPDGAILVTTPQGIAVADVRREVTFCRQGKIPIVGIIENMSGYVCPHCQECTNVFSKGGGQKLASYADIPFLGDIPIDPKLANLVDEGDSCKYTKLFATSSTAQKFVVVSDLLVKNKFINQ